MRFVVLAQFQQTLVYCDDANDEHQQDYKTGEYTFAVDAVIGRFVVEIFEGLALALHGFRSSSKPSKRRPPEFHNLNIGIPAEKVCIDCHTTE